MDAPTTLRRFTRQLWGPLLMEPAAGLARAVRYLPRLRPEDRGVDVTPDLAYGPDLWQRYDLYRPREPSGPLPLLMMIHGGGFQFFDRRSHWGVATAFARAGFVVASVEYRLAPHRFPAPQRDVAAALLHLVRVAADHGADARRTVLAGESAGANLALGLALCWTLPRPEPWAAAIAAADFELRAILPACGYLDVTEPGRHEVYWRKRGRPLHPVVASRIPEVSRAHLPDHSPPLPEHALASPLRLLEALAKGEHPSPLRPLPPVHALVGAVDPVLHDTLRLGAALEALGVDHEVPIYADAGHAFHALPWHRQAEPAWRGQRAFLRRVLGAADAS